MWQNILPLVEVVVIVVIIVMLELFEDVDVNVIVSVARATHTFARSKGGMDDVHKIVVEVAVNGHSPAWTACHIVALGNVGVGEERVEHDNKKSAKVPHPRNYTFGMQRSPTAVARKIMHTGSAAPTHSKTENNKENEEADNEATKIVVEFHVVIARCRGTCRLCSHWLCCSGQHGQSTHP